MKVPLSWLRELVDVGGTAQEIAATMSVRGFAVEGIDEVDGDAVIDFEVTGNRPDCMSIIGMAREIATAYDLTLRRDWGLGTGDSGLGTGDSGLGTGDSGPGAADSGPDPESRIPDPRSPVPDPESPIPDPGDIAITIDDPDLCRCYVGAVADVTVGPSPAWLQARLKACGVRPISNIVDITNYVLLEMGQPMHAFDRTKLGGAQIRVRRARTGERLETLDGQDRTLSPDMLVIADANDAVAVAGVMGGADSEVNDATRTIVFESAYFDPLSVRRTSRRLGLKTEASMRFERGIDPTMARAALVRACALLDEIGAGRAGAPIVAGTLTAEGRRLTLRRARIDRFLGLAIPERDTTRILQSLGFGLSDLAPRKGAPYVSVESDLANGPGWSVMVPPRRVDIAREVDLIEEVARHYGFDRIPSTFPELRSAPPPPDPQIARARRVRHVMTGMGFSEAVTFGFTSERAALPFVSDPKNLVRIKNPLSEAFAVLRPSLLPGLIESASTNVRRGRPDVRLFEMGTRFVRPGGAQQAVTFVWTGAAADVHWSEKPRSVDFFDAKGVLENLALAHDVGVEFGSTAVPPFLTPGKATASLLPRPRTIRPNTPSYDLGPPLGFVGELSRDVADAFGFPATVVVYAAELDWDVLARFEQHERTVHPIPRFPSVVRDISILIDDRTEARAIRTSLTQSASEILEDVREFDRYQGKGIPEDKVSLSLRLTFRSPERTLTDAEVQRTMDAVLATLREKHGAVQR